jgi:aldehyde:ferredoxin oxidoreductase
MDCFEQGLITTGDTGGVTLSFGDADAMVQMVEAIAKREGFGDLLAEGSARAAERIGRGTQDLVVAVKKQEMPAHMPQVKRSLGLIYAVNPFGADHQSHEHDPGYGDYPERMAEIGLTDPQPDDVLNEEKVHYALVTEHLYSALDTVNMCQFVFGPAWQLYSTGHLVEAMHHVTGQDYSIVDVLRIGERRLNLLRAFNARESIGREADKLPKKMYQALTGGASDGVALTEVEVEDAKDIYYQMAGWEVSSGTPTRKKLEELDLGWVADMLEV